MKKLVYCDGCKCGTCNSCGKEPGIKEEYVCDTCGQNLSQGIPITVTFGYGSSLDGTEYNFCNYICLFKFIAAENAKESK